MKKIIKLSERDLTRIVKRVINEKLKYNPKKVVHMDDEHIVIDKKRKPKSNYKKKDVSYEDDKWMVIDLEESFGKMIKNIGKRISGDIWSHTIDDENDPFLQYVRELHGEDVDYIVVNPPEDQFGVGGDLMVGTYNYFKCADEECSYHHGWSDTVPRQFKDYIYKD